MTTTTSYQSTVLRHLPEVRTGDQSVVRLASSRVFVTEDVRISELYDTMISRTEVEAVGVVNSNEEVLGIIVRRDFFATMARPFAQDVLPKHPVREVMTTVRSFSGDGNIFTVSEEIGEDMRKPGITYYLLTWSGKRFAGVFSSQDMLVYLSGITQKDILLARRLQSRIVRDREIAVGSRLELVATSQTAKGVGGDFYKVTRYGENRWIIALCDVSGKGVAASIVTSVLWGMMSIYDFTRGMTSFIQEANNYLVRTFEAEKFVTAVFMDYDETTGKVSICDLGHSHIFLFRRGKMRMLKTNQNNLPLGITPDIEPRIDVARPLPDDLLFVITDGLVEQANLKGEVYNLSRISSIFSEHATQPVEAISDRLYADFNSFRGRRPLGDDVTWTLMRFAPQAITL